MDGRVIFTKDFKEKAEQGLSSRKKGKILYKKLQELEENGRLSKADNRYDVARLVGYAEERIKGGYTWVSGLIKRGKLIEIVRGFTPGGLPISEYHLASTVAKVEKEKQGLQDKVVKPVTTIEDKPEVVKPEVIKVEITKGEITIKIELTSSEQVSELITAVLKGGKNEQDITTSHGANGAS